MKESHCENTERKRAAKQAQNLECFGYPRPIIAVGRDLDLWGHALENRAALRAMDGFIFILAPAVSTRLHDILNAPNT
jgi:hypothetical protein